MARHTRKEPGDLPVTWKDCESHVGWEPARIPDPRQGIWQWDLSGQGSLGGNGCSIHGVITERKGVEGI